MRITKFAGRTAPGAFMLGAALALSACGGAEPEEQEYEVGAEDLSGGEFTTRDPAEPAVPVDIPETEMTMASDEEIAAADAEDAVEEDTAMEPAE